MRRRTLAPVAEVRRVRPAAGCRAGRARGARGDADADVGVAAVEDVRRVAGRAHPRTHDAARGAERAGAPRDVLANGPRPGTVEVVRAVHARLQRRAGRADVREEA